MSKLTVNPRPCTVSGKKALFHMWTEEAQIIPPSPMVGGHGGGVVKDVFALVEYEDGTVERCAPEKVKFCGNVFKEYCFGGNADER